MNFVRKGAIGSCVCAGVLANKYASNNQMHDKPGHLSQKTRSLITKCYNFINSNYNRIGHINNPRIKLNKSNISSLPNLQLLSSQRPDYTDDIDFEPHPAFTNPSSAKRNLEKLQTYKTNNSTIINTSSSWQNEYVTELNANTFDEQIRHRQKDTLVLFYSPTCIHCQRAKPIFEQLSKVLSKRGDVQFAQINVAKYALSESSLSQFRGVPTFVLYLKGEVGGGYRYDGKRSFEGLKKFIESRGRVNTLKH